MLALGAAEAERWGSSSSMIPRSLRRLFRHDDTTVNPVGFIVLGVVLVSVLPTIFVALFMAFMTVHETKNEPRAQQVQNDLESEFRAFQPLPQARSSWYNASHKSSQSLVSSHYQTNLTYSDIRAYYDVELAKHGWKFYEEEQMRDWGRDLG